MDHLSIDLETFSSVPIQKAGAQKYIQSPDFEILLFAYSLNGAEPVCCDFAQGETLPKWVAEALLDPQCLKHAYNAPFEWGCLSRYMGRQLPPAQWRCTMFHGLYAGYTAGLDATGRALGLPEDKRKLNTGKALIRYFCVPCAPSKANGGRTRNYPHHAPERWELFKEYNRQDVTTEMEIERRLSAVPVPDFGLSNPNSVAQLLGWLKNETKKDITDLRKDTVAKMLARDDNSPEVQRMLEIRQELGKTSTKKYDAIEQAVCQDGRKTYPVPIQSRWSLPVTL